MEPSLYKRYVDDINVATDQVEEGTVYEGGALIQNEDREDGEIEPDMRTFNVIKDIGNEIHQSIQLTRDVPSNHPHRKVPILDLKCWKEKVVVEGNEKHLLLHEFYMKEVTSKSVISRDAALAMSSKRTILTQECLRVIMNCHELVGWERVTEHLNFFMARMQAGGYDKEFRYQVLKSALDAFEFKKEEERNG